MLRELSGNVLIIPHQNPDGDTLGCAAALVRTLRAIGKTAVAFETSPVPLRFRYLSCDRVFTRTAPKGKYTVITVDVSAPSQLGDAQALCGDGIAIAIDHHVNNTLIAERKLVMPEKAAAGEIIYELAVLVGVEPDMPTAQALYTAISSDSGGFRFTSTSASTHMIAAKLLETGIDFAEIDRMLFDTVNSEQFEVYRLAYSLLERCCDGRVAMLMFTPEVLEKNGMNEPDYGDITQFGRRLEGVEVGVTVRPKDEKDVWRVSLRSNKYVNVSEIAETFGGGGHYFAAAFTVAGQADEVKERILEQIGKKL